MSTFNGSSTALSSDILRSSLNDVVSVITTKTNPVTLRQIASPRFCNVESIKACLHENIGAGKLASFKIGPINYYASPLTALTWQQPGITALSKECIQNALFTSKYYLGIVVKKLLNSAGG